MRFATLTDKHLNLTSPASTASLSQVYATSAHRSGDFVLHWRRGLAGEYDRYAQTPPEARRG